MTDRTKKKLLAQELSSKESLLGDNKLEEIRPAFKPSKAVPKVEEVIGRALDKIGTYNDLDNKWGGLSQMDKKMKHSFLLVLLQAACGGPDRP